MTKADIVNDIAKSTGVEKVQVQAIVEAFMESVKTSLTKKENVYLRGFGSFIVKKRAQKVARNISKNTLCRHLNRPLLLRRRLNRFEKLETDGFQLLAENRFFMQVCRMRTTT